MKKKAKRGRPCLFTDEEKAEALAMVRRRDLTLEQVAGSMGVFSARKICGCGSQTDGASPVESSLDSSEPGPLEVVSGAAAVVELVAGSVVVPADVAVVGAAVVVADGPVVAASELDVESLAGASATAGPHAATTTISDSARRTTHRVSEGHRGHASS